MHVPLSVSFEKNQKYLDIELYFRIYNYFKNQKRINIIKIMLRFNKLSILFGVYKKNICSFLKHRR